MKIKKKKKNKNGFTLIELIAVISIMIILSTIGVISYFNYLSDTRDASRIAHLSEIEKTFNNYKIIGKLPLPDKKVDVKVDDVLVGYQGYLSNEILKTVDYTGVDGGIDPKDKVFYTYYVSRDLRKFQILGFLENNLNNRLKTYYINQAKAENADYTKRYKYLVGDKLGILVESGTNMPIQEIQNIKSDGFINFTGSLVGTYRLAIENGELYSESNTLVMGNKIKELANIKDTAVIGVPGSELCGGEILDINGINTSTSFLSSANWTRSATPGICTWNCKSGYTWNGSSCEVDNVVVTPFSSCTATGQILTATTTYPGVSVAGFQPIHPSCDTPDFLICSGTSTGLIISACNIGASIAGTGVISYGNVFQWGRNKAFPSSSTTPYTSKVAGTIGLNSSTDTYPFIRENSNMLARGWANTDVADNWGEITNTNLSRQGPCANGYHVPSSNEIITLVNSVSNIRDTLKMPYGLVVTGWGTFSAGGYYWSSNQNNYLVFGFIPGLRTNGAFIGSNGYNVRCFKN